MSGTVGKKRLGAALATLVLGLGASWFALPSVEGQQRSAVTPELQRALTAAAPAERVPVLIEVSRAAVPAPLALGRNERATEQASNLAGLYAGSADRLRGELPAPLAIDLELGEVLWIGGAISARLTPDQVRELEGRSGIQRIYYDGLVQVELAAWAEPPPPLWAPGLPAVQEPGGGLPWGLEEIGAPQLWQVGATGSGSVVAIIDSGVDGDHPLLRRNWRGLSAPVSEAWFDPWGLTAVPFDDDGTGGVGHGTIVAMTAVGSLGAGDTLIDLSGTRVVEGDLEVVTGVAPGAEWVAADGFQIFGGGTYTRRSVLLQALQWVLDPDGDPATVTDVPDVVNNSWGFRAGGCTGVFDRAIDALELAGVAVVFAAGNRSAGIDTVASPADRADLLLNAFAVGAAERRDGEVVVSENSLGGPTPCSPGSIKPEVVAPGDIPLVRSAGARTAVVGSRTGAFTSWAAPHVTGALALLSALDPTAGANELKDALFSTARDLPPTGLDNRSGAGLIDVAAAANRIGGLGGVRVAVAGWSWDTAGAALSIQLTNAGRLGFSGGRAELKRRSDGESLAVSEAPPIPPQARREIRFQGLSEDRVGDGRLALQLESDGSRLQFALSLAASTATAIRLSAGDVEFSLDANGRLGRVAGAPGLSFRGVDWLTSGAFLFVSGERVSDAAYVDVLQQPTLKSNPIGSDTDWRALSSSSNVAHAEVSFSDDRALRPLGATVTQSADLVALGDSAAFVALKASVVLDRPQETPLAGLLLDWDFNGQESLEWDAELGASVMTPADSSGPWMALTVAGRAPTTHAAVPLGTPVGGFYITGPNDGVLSQLEGFTDERKALLMRLGGRQSAEANVSDWAQLVTVGPLRSGSSTVFLIAAADSRAALGAALDNGRLFAATLVDPGGPAPRAASDLQVLPAYPNPFNPNEGGAVALPFLVDRGAEAVQARLEIFTISGRPVYSETRTLDPVEPAEPFRWDGRLADGKAAASGVYGYVIRVGGQRGTGKFVLLK